MNKNDANDLSTKSKKHIIFLSFLAILLVLVIRKVFNGSLILPQSFSLGPVTIRYYGLFIALAVASGFYLAIKRAEKFGFTKKQAEDVLFWAIVSGFIGARLYHVASSFAYYSQHPLDILKVWNGGLSIYGVLIGGVVALWVYCRRARRHVSPVTLLNWLTPSLLLGQIIGRFGNFFNYELYGYPTYLLWKMFVPEGFRAPGYVNNSYFHPLFLYEQIGLLIILIYLIYKEKRTLRSYVNPGSVATHAPKTDLFFWYVLLYNILRIPLEFLRVDSIFLGNIRQNAVASLVLACVAAVLILKHVGRKGQDYN